jgi:hypothetical protein
MMRAGLYRPVHMKTLRSQKLRMLLTNRKLLQSKAIAIDNDLRATLRNFGLKVGAVGTVKFEARIKELVEDIPDLTTLVELLLIVRRVLREQLGSSRCRSRGGADLPGHRRRAGSLQELQGGRGGVWTDTIQVSVRRERANRRHIAVRRRDDADDALRSRTGHAGAVDEMVMAQGLGDADRQAPRNEEGDRRTGTPAGRNHAPHLG